MKTRTQPSRKISDSYFKLVMDFPLVSIKSERQFQAAQKMIDRLLVKGKLNSGEETYLEALSDLLAAYEDVHYPIAPASDAEMLKHLMDAKSVDFAELHRKTGIPRSTIAEVLSGKKLLDSSLVKTLASFFR